MQLILLACAGEPEFEKDDTASATDSDSGDSEDSGVDSEDSGDGSGSPLTFLVDGETAGVKLGFFPIVNLETLEVLDARAVQDLANPLTVDPGQPAEESVFEQEGLEMGLAVIGAWQDDGDETQSEGEDFVSASRLAIWLAGELPPPYAELGMREGWNVALASSLQDSVPVVYDPDAVPLPLLSPREELTLAGAYDGDADGVNVAIVPISVQVNGWPEDYFYDHELEGPEFEIELSGRPADDHFADTDFDGVEEAAEVVLAYEDASRPDGLGDGDALIGAGCVDGEPVLAYWLEEFDELSFAVVWDGAGLVPGWNPVAIGPDSFRVLEEEEQGQLLVSPACQLN